MKKYIAPACEMMDLAANEMLALSFEVDPDTKVDDMASNRFQDFEGDWED